MGDFWRRRSKSVRVKEFSRRAEILHYYGCMSAEPDGAPPFLGTWKRVYVAVLIYLAAVIAAFYVFTQAHR